MIITRTPYRISLYGGGSDIPNFYNYSKVGGAVISFSIKKYIYIIVKKSFDNYFHLKYSKYEKTKKINNIKHNIIREILKYFKIKEGLEIHSIGDFPGKGTGLGSSSSFAVGLVNAISLYKNIKLTKYEIAKIASNIEIHKCYPSIGKQDQYAASFGGFNFISFRSNKVIVEKIHLKKNQKKKLENLIIINTNIDRKADQIIKNYHLNKTNFEFLEMIVKEVYEMKNKIGSNFNIVINKLRKNWKFKIKLNKNKINKKIINIYKKSLKLGAISGKLLGAGGGGFMLFYILKKKQNYFIKKLKKHNPTFVDIDYQGTTQIFSD